MHFYDIVYNPLKIVVSLFFFQFPNCVSCRSFVIFPLNTEIKNQIEKNQEGKQKWVKKAVIINALDPIGN